MSEEEKKAIEYLKENINYFKEQIKIIKNYEIILNLIQKQEKEIMEKSLALKGVYDERDKWKTKIKNNAYMIFGQNDEGKIKATEVVNIKILKELLEEDKYLKEINANDVEFKEVEK